MLIVGDSASYGYVSRNLEGEIWRSENTGAMIEFADEWKANEL